MQATVGGRRAERVRTPIEPRRGLVPVLDIRDELRLRLLLVAAVLAQAWFWLWWFQSGSGPLRGANLVVTALLAWVFALPGYFFFFVARMKRPDPTLPLPRLRAAMVVTKAPSEPWPVVRTTLEAMLAQRFSRPFEVWLADERPSDETRQWCRENRVSVSTRRGRRPRITTVRLGPGGPDARRATSPTSTTGSPISASTWSSSSTPTTSPTTAISRRWSGPSPTPAWVTWPPRASICDSNIEDGWTVKGRLYREAALHGPVQAGSNDGWAPVCIGSHYDVRTAALRDIGGIGPELAEDYSTSLAMQAAGWSGVFSIDAEAHGEGPATAEEMLIQELQWSRSLGTLAVRWAPAKLRSVPWRARLRLGFALAFYPFQGIALAVAAVAPAIGAALGFSWGQASLAAFYLHVWPASVVTLAVAAFLRRRELLRPTHAKLWSWELLLFQLVRWPWDLVGFFQGAYAGLRSRVVTFKVTPKADAGVKTLAPSFLVPTLLLGAVPAWTVVLVRHPGPAVGLMVVATLQALTYLACAVAVVVLHVHANQRRLAPTPAGAGGLVARWGLAAPTGGAAAAMTTAVVVPTVAALVWRLGVVGLAP